MEKDVEKIYNDVLKSINCENDDFINSYFENDDITEEMQGNTIEDDDFYDDWNEEPKVESVEIPVENYVENIDEVEETSSFKVEIPTETVENYETEFNDNDFESLLTSSEEFDNIMIDKLEEVEIQKELIEEEQILPEELIDSEVIMEEISETVEEKQEFTTDDLLELIEKTDNSEDFFEKLEDRLDD